MKKLLFPLLAALALLGTTAAHAQTPTVIDRLPYTISAAGFYVLTSNLSSSQTSGNLITVDASNVTIDLQGHYLSGPAGNYTQTTAGIYGRDINNVTIQNGTVANLRYGILLDSSGSTTKNNINHELDHLRVTRCNYIGILLVKASSTSITNCKLSVIGYSGNSAGSAGISVYGAGVTVQNCELSLGFGAGSYGISLDTGSFARQNTLSSFYCGVSKGKYQDNLTNGCSVPFEDGIDAGGNN